MRNYDILKKTYPEYISLDQFYRICKIAKRSAATKAGNRQAVFYNGGYKRKTTPLFDQIDVLDYLKKYDKPNSLATRLKSNTCELCGASNVEIEIHQVKRLKDLTGTAEWEKIMLKRHRKTLAVCADCHKTIHVSD